VQAKFDHGSVVNEANVVVSNFMNYFTPQQADALEPLFGDKEKITLSKGCLVGYCY
jgi:hypothetical protein